MTRRAYGPAHILNTFALAAACGAVLLSTGCGGGGGTGTPPVAPGSGGAQKAQSGGQTPSPSPASPSPSPAAHQTPTASPSAAPAAAQGDFLGCPYPSGDVWQTDVSSAALASNSAQMIQATSDAITSLGSSQSFNVWTPVTLYVNSATGATPLVPVVPAVSYHTPYSPVPWLATFQIESASDAHSMVVQTQTCQYYEGYETTYASETLKEYNGSHWDLTQPFTRPASNPGSSASGIPIGLLAVRPEELAAGTIEHALGWDAVASTVADDVCVSPAAASGCGDSLPYDGPSADASHAIPYGAHIRLKATFDDSGFPREAQIVAEALKHYGAYLYDTGCCNAIPFAGDQDGAATWTAADASALAGVTIQDFDVVQSP